MLDQFLLELKRLPRPQPILAGFVVAFLAALLLAYREVIEWYWLPRWGDPNGYYSYAYLVPPLAIVMIWMRREQLITLRAQPSFWGIPLLLVGAGLHLLGHWGLSSWLSSMGFPLFLIGGSLTLFGARITRVLLYPLAFLYLMMPMPSVVFDEVTNPIKVWSTEVSLAILSPFYNILETSQVTFIMPSGYELHVGVECSGFKVTIALLTFILFFFTLVDLPLWKKLILPLALFPIAILSNGVRIALIAIFGHHFGPEAGKIAHEGFELSLPVLGTVNIPTTGALEILIPFVALFLIARWLGWKR
ncbi:MAG: exosortase/archaeosortase family protein [Fimbriimonadales bacterium]|nr:exosortase/archaeosortase family protein [Fimbriimonadales bacterium]